MSSRHVYSLGHFRRIQLSPKPRPPRRHILIDEARRHFLIDGRAPDLKIFFPARARPARRHILIDGRAPDLKIFFPAREPRRHILIDGVDIIISRQGLFIWKILIKHALFNY